MKTVLRPVSTETASVHLTYCYIVHFSLDSIHTHLFVMFSLNVKEEIKLCSKQKLKIKLSFNFKFRHSINVGTISVMKMNEELVKKSSSQDLRPVTLAQMHVKTIYKARTCVIFESYCQIRATPNTICNIHTCVCVCVECQLHHNHSVWSFVIYRLARIQGQGCLWRSGETESLRGATCPFFYLALSALRDLVRDGDVGQERVVH